MIDVHTHTHTCTHTMQVTNLESNVAQIDEKLADLIDLVSNKADGK